MANHSIYLKLVGDNLQWSPDGSQNWQIVSKQSPTTIAKRNEQVEWISNDDSISKIKVKFDKTDIFKTIQDNDSKKPKGNVKNDAEANTVDKYEIWVKKGDNSGDYLRFDPEMKVPDPPE